MNKRDSSSHPARVAVVTGASQGLGLALAEALARDGWALVIDARRADRLTVGLAGLAVATAGTVMLGELARLARRRTRPATVPEVPYEVPERPLEATGRAIVAYRVFFNTPRTLSRPSRTPVSRARTVANSRQLH